MGQVRGPVPGLLPANLLSAGLLPALGLALVVVVVVMRPDAGADGDDPDDDGRGDDGAADDAEMDDGEAGADEGRADSDDAGGRGRAGPFPLPLGGVPLEFNAVSPLWRHHRLPAH